MTDRFELSKLDAARRQLTVAIRLLFDGVDPVAVHTLVGAASIIISDLVDLSIQKSLGTLSGKSRTVFPHQSIST